MRSSMAGYIACGNVCSRRPAAATCAAWISAARVSPACVRKAGRPARVRSRLVNSTSSAGADGADGADGDRGVLQPIVARWRSCPATRWLAVCRSEEHTSELQSLAYLVCRLLLEKKKKNILMH